MTLEAYENSSFYTDCSRRKCCAMHMQSTPEKLRNISCLGSCVNGADTQGNLYRLKTSQHLRENACVVNESKDLCVKRSKDSEDSVHAHLQTWLHG